MKITQKVIEIAEESEVFSETDKEEVQEQEVVHENINNFLKEDPVVENIHIDPIEEIK